MEKKNKKLPIILTVLFSVSMIFLTIFSKKIHYSLLPKVETIRITREEFELDKGSSSFVSEWAIPKELYKNGGVYVVTFAEKYGAKRAYVTHLPVVIGRENKNYYEILDFMDYGTRLILHSSREISEGNEVYLEK